MRTVTGLNSTISVGITALMIGLAGSISMAAHADDWGWRDGHRDLVRVDYRDIRHDEDRIDYLQHKLDGQERHHDWRGARDTRRDLDAARDRLERDRRELHRDRDDHDYHRHE